MSILFAVVGSAIRTILGQTPQLVNRDDDKTVVVSDVDNYHPISLLLRDSKYPKFQVYVAIS